MIAKLQTMPLGLPRTISRTPACLLSWLITVVGMRIPSLSLWMSLQVSVFSI